MIDEGDCGATGGMKIGRGNQSTLLCITDDTVERHPKMKKEVIMINYYYD
jgi:hypothetical protein